jgi:hypothetical protein
MRRVVPGRFMGRLRIAGCYAGGVATSIADEWLKIQLIFLAPWIARF